MENQTPQKNDNQNGYKSEMIGMTLSDRWDGHRADKKTLEMVLSIFHNLDKWCTKVGYRPTMGDAMDIEECDEDHLDVNGFYIGDKHAISIEYRRECGNPPRYQNFNIIEMFPTGTKALFLPRIKKAFPKLRRRQLY